MGGWIVPKRRRIIQRSRRDGKSPPGGAVKTKTPRCIERIGAMRKWEPRYLWQFFPYMRSYAATNILDSLWNRFPIIWSRGLITVNLISEMCHDVQSGDFDDVDRGVLVSQETSAVDKRRGAWWRIASNPQMSSMVSLLKREKEQKQRLVPTMSRVPWRWAFARFEGESSL